MADLVDPALRGLAEERLLKREFENYLTLLGSHARWEPLVQLVQRGLCGDGLPALFHDVWICAKNLPSPQILEYLLSAIPECPKAFTDADKATFEGLPERIKIYRGFPGPNIESRSWTLARSIARDFAKYESIAQHPDGRMLLRQGTPRVATLEIPKKFVLFYTNERQEQEIVLRLPERGRARVLKTP